MGNDRKLNTNHKPESSSKKDSLIKALAPLFNDFPWLRESITSIETSPLFDSDLELSGLARKIVYELSKTSPTLFDDENNPKTLPLKNLIRQLFDNIEVLKNRKENIAKIIEEIYNAETRKKATKTRSKL